MPMHSAPGLRAPGSARAALAFGLIGIGAQVIGIIVGAAMILSFSLAVYQWLWMITVFGLLGWVGIIVAIITGHIGVYQTGPRFGRRGRGMAVAGLVIGYGLLVLSIVAAIAHPTPFYL
ncbi:MAG: hypothetical protein ABI435_00410 [Pseudolysinimonas sp.]